MAWDDTPPSAEEVAPSSGWDAAPPTKDEMEDTKGFLATAASNVLPDIKAVGKSLATPWPVKAMDLMEHGAVKHAMGESLPDIALEAGKAVAEPALHPIKYAEEHPVQQALNAATVFGLGEGMMGEAAPEAAAIEAAPKSIPEAILPEPKMAEPVPMRTTPEPTLQPASRIPPPPGSEPVPAAPAKAPLSDLSNITNALPDKAKEVKDYISRGYQGFAKKPGATADIADYIQGKSQMMAAQEMGATPMQARQAGHDEMRAIGQYALDKEIVSPTNGLRGMRARNTELLKKAGDAIGDFREAADKAGPAYQPGELLSAVKARLDPKYARGAYSGESGGYAKALEDVADAEPTHAGVADAATKLNKAANDAMTKKIAQPHGPYTDVANAISDINNERIKAKLGTQAPAYEQALREYGVNKKIGEFLKRKEAGEVKRLGPGSLTSNLTQKMLDEIGYKVGAKAANRLSTSVLKNAAVGKTLPSLFKEFINQVETVGDEISGGMSSGGLVPGDVAEWMQNK